MGDGKVENIIWTVPVCSLLKLDLAWAEETVLEQPWLHRHCEENEFVWTARCQTTFKLRPDRPKSVGLLSSMSSQTSCFIPCFLCITSSLANANTPYSSGQEGAKEGGSEAAKC